MSGTDKLFIEIDTTPFVERGYKWNDIEIILYHAATILSNYYEKLPWWKKIFIKPSTFNIDEIDYVMGEIKKEYNYHDN